MSLPHTFLIGGIAFWVAASWAAPKSTSTSEPVLGVAGSPYGSLMARLMRDSLFAYWHGGVTAENSDHADHENDHVHGPECEHGEEGEGAHHSETAHVHGPECDHPDGHSEHVHGPECEHEGDVEDHSKESLFDRSVAGITRLEASRTQRNSPFAISSAHRLYMDAAAKWRLRLACHLDPGDVVLYEILYANTGLEKLRIEGRTVPAAQYYSARAIRRAISPQAGLSDSLAGAGAAINQVNEALQPELKQEINILSLRQSWQYVNQCLHQYHALRERAISDGWWTGIPEMRREEFDSHAEFLERMIKNLQEHMVKEQILTLK